MTFFNRYRKLFLSIASLVFALLSSVLAGVVSGKYSVAQTDKIFTLMACLLSFISFFLSLFAIAFALFVRNLDYLLFAVAAFLLSAIYFPISILWLLDYGRSWLLPFYSCHEMLANASVVILLLYMLSSLGLFDGFRREEAENGGKSDD